MTRFVSVVFCITLLATACQQAPFPEHIKRLDETLAQNDSAMQALGSIDSAQIAKTGAETADLMAGLQAEFAASTDTLSREQGLLLGELKDIRKGCTRLLDALPRLRKTLHETDVTLNDLKHDINANLLNKAQVNEYTTREIGLSTEAITEAKRLPGVANQLLERFNAKKTQADSLLQNTAAASAVEAP